MSNITEQHIQSMYEMQMDLLADGEMPTPFSDIEYYIECLVHGEEEPEALARILAEGAAIKAHSYAAANGLHTGTLNAAGGYMKAIIKDAKGNQCAKLCYEKDDYNSQALALGAISDTYPKVIWL